MNPYTYDGRWSPDVYLARPGCCSQYNGISRSCSALHPSIPDLVSSNSRLDSRLSWSMHFQDWWCFPSWRSHSRHRCCCCCWYRLRLARGARATPRFHHVTRLRRNANGTDIEANKLQNRWCWRHRVRLALGPYPERWHWCSRENLDSKSKTANTMFAFQYGHTC